MATQVEMDRAAEAFDRVFLNFDDPTPLVGKELKRFQRRCFVEAKRLMRVLATPRLGKTVRDDIENMALFWCVMSQKEIIEGGECRLLHSLLGRRLKQFKEEKVGPVFPYPEDL